jgi:hypothetical protein
MLVHAETVCMGHYCQDHVALSAANLRERFYDRD